MRSTLTLLLGLWIPSAAFAEDANSWQLRVGSWQADADGETGARARPTAIAALGFTRHYNNMASLAFDPHRQWFPKLLLTHTDVAYSGDAILRESFGLGTVIFDADIRTLSTLVLSHTDFSLHYPVFGDPVQIDIGVTGRLFDGYVEAETELTAPTRSTLKGALPMLYLRSQYALPDSGWTLSATAQVIRYRGDGFHDYAAEVSYVYPRKGATLGLNLGYRKLSLDVANFDNLYVDASLSGAYLQLVVAF